MKLIPIVFHGWEVQAIKRDAFNYLHRLDLKLAERLQPGDQIWVRETFTVIGKDIVYCADQRPGGYDTKWKPPGQMSLLQSRFSFEVTGVTRKRIQEMGDREAMESGVESFTKDRNLHKYWTGDPTDGDLKCTWVNLPRTPIKAFSERWKAQYGLWSWDANPEITCLELKRV